MILMSFWLVLALFLDQFSKKIIVELVSPGETFEVLGNFLMITNVGNTGISFGMFQGYTHILIPLVFVIIGLVFIVSLKFVNQSSWLAFAFGAIIGGALGNQIDRLFKGAVVDFIYVNGFAVFNVSDSFVVIGAFILGVHTIFATEGSERILNQQNDDLKQRIANLINDGTFDYFGKTNRVKEHLISWLLNKSEIQTILFYKNNEKETIESLERINIQTTPSPILLIQDVSYTDDQLLLLNGLKNQKDDKDYYVFFISSIKKFLKTQIVFENERQFRTNSIRRTISSGKSKEIEKKPLLKIIMSDKKNKIIQKNEFEGRPVIMTTNDFILEIVTEEIPPTEIFGLQRQFEKGFSEFLGKLRIKHEQMNFFYSARRFGIYIHDMSLKQEDLVELKRGPAKKIAFDSEGKPSKALFGFLKGNKASKEDLIFKEENSNEYCYIKRKVKGKESKEILEKNLTSFLENLNFKKPMRWANGDYKFVRPVHNILAILSTDLIDFDFMGISSAKTTLAHRFKDKKVYIESPDVYFEKMMENNVYADQEKRKEKIIEAIRKIEMSHDITIPKDEALIDEVTAITENPNAVLGSYDERFLTLPKEVLITTLKHHQRTFPALKNKKIVPFFLSFQDNEEHSVPNVKAGYRKVIEARLEDALFYYREDLKQPFVKRTEQLKNIGFQNKLGSLYEKVLRVDKLSNEICSIFELDEKTKEKVHQSCILLKNDLTTQMVYEFPELQGIMGRIYAEISGETYDVYHAIEEQYDDQAPETLCGSITTLSDNIDTIAGNLLINNIPSGSKDPFGLRRALTKCLKIIISREWDMNLNQIFLTALSLYVFDLTQEKKQSLSDTFVELLKNRIEYYLNENNIDYDIINATLHLAKNPIRCIFAAKSLMDVRKNEDFINLTRIFERIHNISKKHESRYYDARLFEHDEEIRLEERFNDIRDEVGQALNRFDYKTALEVIKGLKEPVDNYFDNVFVMSEREDLKLTRLGFLKTLDDFLLNLGDFSEIVQNSEYENE